MKKLKQILNLFICLNILNACSEVYDLKTVDWTAEDYVVTNSNSFEINTLSNSIKESVHIYLVVDNSNSMKEAQKEMIEGVKQLVDHLKGYNVSFSVIPTTLRWSYNRATKRVVPYSVEYGYKVYEQNNGQETYIGGRVGNGAARLRNSNTRRIVSTLNATRGAKNKSLTITESMNADEINTIKDNLVKTVEAMGTDGSSQEMAFASIGHVLNRHSDQSQNSVILFLSDDDDQSPLTRDKSKINYGVSSTGQAHILGKIETIDDPSKLRLQGMLENSARMSQIKLYKQETVIVDGLPATSYRLIQQKNIFQDFSSLELSTQVAKDCQNNIANPTLDRYGNVNFFDSDYKNDSDLNSLKQLLNSTNSEVTHYRYVCWPPKSVIFARRYTSGIHDAGVFVDLDIDGTEPKFEDVCDNSDTKNYKVKAGTQLMSAVQDRISASQNSLQWQLNSKNQSCDTVFSHYIPKSKEITLLSEMLAPNELQLDSALLKKFIQMNQQGSVMLGSFIQTEENTSSASCGQVGAQGKRYIKLLDDFEKSGGLSFKHNICKSDSYGDVLKDKVGYFVKNVAQSSYDISRNRQLIEYDRISQVLVRRSNSDGNTVIIEAKQGIDYQLSEQGDKIDFLGNFLQHNDQVHIKTEKDEQKIRYIKPTKL